MGPGKIANKFLSITSTHIQATVAVTCTLRNGLIYCFKLKYSGLRISIFCANLKSIIEHSEGLLNKINKEVLEGRMAGPFEQLPCITCTYLQ